MTFTEIFVAIEGAPFAKGIREGASLFPWIESVHVLAVVIVVGMVAVMDLRLIGLSNPSQSVRKLLADALPYTWAAFVVAVVSGFLLFSSSAVSYSENWPFRVKAIALILAGANMFLFHFTTYRSAHLWDELTHPPIRARIAGIVSVTCWVLVVAAGRWIGFAT